MESSFRPPAVPLITVDPYFSIWSANDNLYDGETISWTLAKKPLSGFITIDSKRYTFLGKNDSNETMIQKSLDITATASIYYFLGQGISLKVIFRSPLLLSNLELISRPCSYVDFEISSIDGNEHKVEIDLGVHKSLCYNETEKKMFYGVVNTDIYKTVYMGQAKQCPLSNSGDMIDIDWGYLYLASRNSSRITLNHNENCNALISLDVIPDKVEKEYLVLAYDDIASIVYFGDIMKGYWAKDGKNIFDIMELSVKEHDMIVKKCEVFDEQLYSETYLLAGDEYAKICALSYRQTIAAHKLIQDKDGNPIFLSKENNSNGCIGTVDVSYPSVPLYLIYNPELVKAMMRPIFKFSRLPVWKYDFAPHDVGRYPYACGQVYGIKNTDSFNSKGLEIENGEHFAFTYQFPHTCDMYDLKYQMPVEECGNMLIMTAAVTVIEDDVKFAKENMDLLEKWVCYLVEFGSDPGEQLCTDDFAGHLARNVNLAAKAIMGIASYAIILNKIGNIEEAKGYFIKAQSMAINWLVNSKTDNGTMLSFENKDSWSIKYNTIWDLIFKTELFSKDFFDKEVKHYIKVQNEYGLPLDSRSSDAKSDWILWCVAMAKTQEDMSALIHPVYDYLNKTTSRVAFSDWYNTETGKYIHFINRTVQGGIFMPLLKSYISK